MAKLKRKKKQRTVPAVELMRPTPERMDGNSFERAGLAWRAKNPVRKLFDEGKITPSEFDNLDHYRQLSQKAQDDEAEMSPMHPEKSMGGGGAGSGPCIPASLLCSTPAQVETLKIEREVLVYGQSLLDLLRFVARDEKTLAQWCIETTGGRERRDGTGKAVTIVPVAEKRVMREALLHLRYVAGVIVR